MMTYLANNQVDLGSPFNTGITIHQTALLYLARLGDPKEIYLIWDTWLGQRACLSEPDLL